MNNLYMIYRVYNILISNIYVYIYIHIMYILIRREYNDDNDSNCAN